MSDFVMNNEPIAVQLNIDPRPGKQSLVTHYFRRPTLKEEEKREMMMPIITEETGVTPEEGTAAPTVKLEDEPANAWLYDALITHVEGKPYGFPEKTEVTEELKSQIPSGHKNTAVYGLFPGDFELDIEEDAEYVFNLASKRSWDVKHSIGLKKFNEDGSLADPDYIITYTVSEPSVAQRNRFKLKAMSNAPYIKKGGLRVDRQSANLKVLSELFDELISSVNGATFLQEDGSEVSFDARNEEHVASIPAQYKKSVMRVVFNSLEADLGK